MLSRSAEIAARFDAHASDYEKYAQLQRGVAARLAEFLPALMRPRVLELGCGTGLFSRELLARYPDGEFVLSDLSPRMLHVCRRNLGETAQSVVFEVADEGARASAPFDLIAMSMALHWFPDPRATLAELRRRLAPGGRLVFATLGPDSFAEWRAALAATGLPSGLVTVPELPGVIEQDRLVPDTTTLDFLRRMKMVGGITPRQGYAPLQPGALRRAIRVADAKYGGRITWDIVYGSLGPHLENLSTPSMSPA